MVDVESWLRFGRALQFYGRRGYQYVDAWWHTTEEVAAVTCPDRSLMAPFPEPRSSEPFVLVGSAEQSLMRMQFRSGTLPPGRWMALTPCFRPGDLLKSRLHEPYFMKLELYSNGSMDSNVDLMQDAYEFMGTECPSRYDVKMVSDPLTDDYDLQVGGVEVGSYNSRSHGDHRWVCGTGLAEPRFSMALEEARKNERDDH